MTIASQITESIYTGNGVTTNFPITFEYSDIADIKLQLDGVDETNFTFDNALTPTEIIPDNLVASGVVVRVFRDTETIQSLDLQANQNYSQAAESIENQLDKIVQMIQEIEVPASPVTSNNTEVVFPDWEVATAYSKGVVLFDTDSERYYRVVNDGYSSDPIDISADIQAGNLEVFPENNKGDKGDKGDKGVAGNDGADGAVGATGAAGADGIFSEIANQAEAEAGVNNDKGMTPLRAKQAFDVQYATSIQPTTDAITTINTELVRLNNEVELVKSSISTAIGRYSGAQLLEENATTPVAIEGLNGGVPLTFNRNGTEFVNVQIYIRRGAEQFSSFEAILHFVNGTWLIARKETFVLDESLEVDGVTLSVTTDAMGIGQVSYTTEPLVGAFVAEDNYIMYLGQEIPFTILN